MNPFLNTGLGDLPLTTGTRPNPTMETTIGRGTGRQILAAVAAFLTKPYFLFGAGAAGLWVLWERGILGTGPKVSSKTYRLHVPSFVSRRGEIQYKAPTNWARWSYPGQKERMIHEQGRILRDLPAEEPTPPTQQELLERRVSNLETALKRAGIKV